MLAHGDFKALVTGNPLSPVLFEIQREMISNLIDPRCIDKSKGCASNKDKKIFYEMSDLDFISYQGRR